MGDVRDEMSDAVIMIVVAAAVIMAVAAFGHFYGLW